MIDKKVEFLPLDAYRFLGQELVIRSNSPDVLSHFRKMYGRFRTDIKDDPQNRKSIWEDIRRPGMQVIDNLDESDELFIDDRYFLYRLSRTDGYDHFTCRNLQTDEEDLSGFCDHLTLLQSAILRTIAVQAEEDYHLIHAGVVSKGNDGIILPATSGMGKTTLVLKLVSSGFKFLSDEVACIDPDRRIVEPFPRKLNIRTDSLKFLDLNLTPGSEDNYSETHDFERMIDIEDIVPGSLSGQCTPRFVIFLRGFGDKPNLEYISSSNAIFELLNSSIGPIDDPSKLLFRFTPLLNEAKCFNLVLGDLDDTTELLMYLFDEE